MLMELRHPNVLEFVGWNSIECLLVTELMRKGSLYTSMHISILTPMQAYEHTSSGMGGMCLF